MVLLTFYGSRFRLFALGFSLVIDADFELFRSKFNKFLAACQINPSHLSGLFIHNHFSLLVRCNFNQETLTV